MENDIKNLFKKIDGKTDTYQEIHRDELNEQAKQRWPLLRDVRANTAFAHPLRNAPAQAGAGFETQAKPAPTVLSVATSPVLADAGIKSRTLNSLPVQDERKLFAAFASKIAVAPAQNMATPDLQASSAPEVPVSSVPATNSVVNKGLTSVASSNPQSNFHKAHAAPSVSSNKNTETSLHALFDRLAQKSEPEKLPESPVNSFFKKIFKP